MGFLSWLVRKRWRGSPRPGPCETGPAGSRSGVFRRPGAVVDGVQFVEVLVDGGAHPVGGGVLAGGLQVALGAAGGADVGLDLGLDLLVGDGAAGEEVTGSRHGFLLRLWAGLSGPTARQTDRVSVCGTEGLVSGGGSRDRP